ncbi:MAG: hypothetical protein NUV49_02480 [Patescibacteria group bacterium]|nr:hypothetical protein [Patescibacteria group bacterium]
MRILVVLLFLLGFTAGCNGNDSSEPLEETETYSETKIDTVYVTLVTGIPIGLPDAYLASEAKTWEELAKELRAVEVYGITSVSVPDTTVLSWKTVVVKPEAQKPNTMYFRAMRDSTIQVPDVTVHANRHYIFEASRLDELLARLQKNIGKRVIFEYVNYNDSYLRKSGSDLEAVTFLEEGDAK